ncbi:MAG: hypothetical protein ACRCX2_01090 [Paraclostridium sp.]
MCIYYFLNGEYMIEEFTYIKWQRKLYLFFFLDYYDESRIVDDIFIVHNKGVSELLNYPLKKIELLHDDKFKKKIATGIFEQTKARSFWRHECVEYAISNYDSEYRKYRKDVDENGKPENDEFEDKYVCITLATCPFDDRNRFHRSLREQFVMFYNQRTYDKYGRYHPLNRRY